MFIYPPHKTHLTLSICRVLELDATILASIRPPPNREARYLIEGGPAFACHDQILEEAVLVDIGSPWERNTRDQVRDVPQGLTGNAPVPATFGRITLLIGEDQFAIKYSFERNNFYVT